MTDYRTITTSTDGAIGTIKLLSEPGRGHGGASSSHSEVGRALDVFRFDNNIRVVVITGENDIFYTSPPGRPRMENRNPADDWDLGQGMQKTYQTIIEMEKPVIAKVNGRCSSFGFSLVFACDFIIAREDAIFGDPHIGMGEGEHYPMGRTDSGVVPGDGSTVFLPLHMSPPVAREFLWLAKQISGADLARKDTINAAVPADKLDEAVATMAAALLRRPAYALALSKRAFNKFIAERFNQTFDLAWAYEALNFYQFGRYIDGRGDERL